MPARHPMSGPVLDLIGLPGAMALVQNAWAALSLFALTAGLGGISLVALALSVPMPWRLRAAGITLGAALLVGAGLYQTGRSQGALDVLALQHERALAAERLRAELAERIAADIAAQAAQDFEAERSANAQLKELLDDANKRADARRICLPRDVARRLRTL